jgi:hypothetical protein
MRRFPPHPVAPRPLLRSRRPPRRVGLAGLRDGDHAVPQRDRSRTQRDSTEASTSPHRSARRGRGRGRRGPLRRHGRLVGADDQHPHRDGYDTSYLHLSSLAVRAGARVSAGERVGAVGTTGPLGDAPHLHFGVRDAGTRHDYHDPLAFLRHRRRPRRKPPPAATAPAPHRRNPMAARDAPRPGVRAVATKRARGRHARAVPRRTRSAPAPATSHHAAASPRTASAPRRTLHHRGTPWRPHPVRPSTARRGADRTRRASRDRASRRAPCAGRRKARTRRGAGLGWAAACAALLPPAASLPDWRPRARATGAERGLTRQARIAPPVPRG